MAHPAIVIASSTLPHASQGCNQRGLPRGAAHVMQRRLRNGDVRSHLCPRVVHVAALAPVQQPCRCGHVQVRLAHTSISHLLWTCDGRIHYTTLARTSVPSRSRWHCALGAVGFHVSSERRAIPARLWPSR
ncbi:hypothetical protein BJV77DRAFT_1161927 [Russula vinacea]|nr:hypothetical protein BJV77DRAFT_1161927 [Russula vinacea]